MTESNQESLELTSDSATADLIRAMQSARPCVEDSASSLTSKMRRSWGGEQVDCHKRRMALNANAF